MGQALKTIAASLALPLFMTFSTHAEEAEVPIANENKNASAALVTDTALVENTDPAAISNEKKTIEDLFLSHAKEALKDDLSRLIVTYPDDYMDLNHKTGLPRTNRGRVMAHILTEITPQLIADENKNAPEIIKRIQIHKDFGTKNIAPSASCVPSGIEGACGHKVNDYNSIVMHPRATSSHHIEQGSAAVLEPACTWISPYPSEYYELFISLHEFGHVADLSIFKQEERSEALKAFTEAIADCYAIVAFEQLRDKYPDSLPDSEKFVERINSLRAISVIQKSIRNESLEKSLSHFTSPFLKDFRDIVAFKRDYEGGLADLTSADMLKMARDHVLVFSLDLAAEDIREAGQKLDKYIKYLTYTPFKERARLITKRMLTDLDPADESNKLAIALLEDYVAACELISATQPTDPEALFEAWKKSVLQPDENVDLEDALALENTWLQDQITFLDRDRGVVTSDYMRSVIQGLGSGANSVDIPLWRKAGFIHEQMAILKKQDARPASAPAAKPTP